MFRDFYNHLSNYTTTIIRFRLVNIGEYSPRLRLGKYSPIFTSLSVNNIIVKYPVTFDSVRQVGQQLVNHSTTTGYQTQNVLVVGILPTKYMSQLNTWPCCVQICSQDNFWALAYWNIPRTVNIVKVRCTLAVKLMTLY